MRKAMQNKAFRYSVVTILEAAVMFGFIWAEAEYWGNGYSQLTQGYKHLVVSLIMLPFIINAGRYFSTKEN